MGEMLQKWVSIQESLMIGTYEVHFVRYFDRVVNISNIRSLANEMGVTLKIHDLGHGAYLGSFELLDWTFEGVYYD